MIAKEVLQRLGEGGGRGWTSDVGWEDNSLSLMIDNICTAFKEEILSLDQSQVLMLVQSADQNS